MRLIDLMKSLASDIPLTRPAAKRGVVSIFRALLGALFRGETASIDGIGRFRVLQNGEGDGGVARLLIEFVAHPRFSPLSDAQEDPFLPKPSTQMAIEYYRARLEGRSSPEWWRFIPSVSTEHWQLRASLAARYARPGDTVADVGCGGMKLEKLLPAGCRYLPIDLVPRDGRTLVIDLNAPDKLAFQADVAFCLGVLEYVLDAPAVLAWLRGCAPRLVLSFNVSHFDLVEHSFWATLWSLDELRRNVAAAGWIITEEVELNGGGQVLLYLIRPTDASEGAVS